MLTLYLLTPIIRFYLSQTHQFNLLLPLYAYISIQWLLNIQLAYNTLAFKFAAHFDLQNLSYAIGKAGLIGLLAATLLELMKSQQVDPKTGQISFDNL